MTVLIDETEYLSLAEAGRQLQTTETRILMLLKQKALAGELVEGVWLVTAASVAGFDARSQTAQEASCITSCTRSGCSCHG